MKSIFRKQHEKVKEEVCSFIEFCFTKHKVSQVQFPDTDVLSIDKPDVTITGLRKEQGRIMLTGEIFESDETDINWIEDTAIEDLLFACEQLEMALADKPVNPSAHFTGRLENTDVIQILSIPKGGEMVAREYYFKTQQQVYIDMLEKEPIFSLHLETENPPEEVKSLIKEVQKQNEDICYIRFED